MGALVLVLTAFAAGWWGTRQALFPSPSPLAVPEPLTYAVVPGEVGRSLTFAAVAEWELSEAARNAASGTVTSVEIIDGTEVGPGQVLYRMDLRPVVVARGEIPAFRDLTTGLEGPDVAQLQGLLAELGFYQGPVDGRYGSETAGAVGAWQKSLGNKSDGVVRRGDLVFLPELPARVALGEGIEVGAPLSGGELAVLRVAEQPSFTIPLSVEQRSLVPLSAHVLISHPGGQWEGEIASARETTEGQLDLVLVGKGGGSVCGEACPGLVPVGERIDFPVEVVVIPRTQGPVVPVAALQAEAGGRLTVRLLGGEVVEVEVLAASGGLAVVQGLEVGDVIVLPVTQPGEESPG